MAGNNKYVGWLFFIAISAMLISVISLVIINIKINDLYSIHSCSLSKDAIQAKFDGIDTRFADLYIWVGFFITAMAGVLVLNWFHSKGVAKDEAERELKTLKDSILLAEKELDEARKSYKETTVAFDFLKADVDKMIATAKELENKFNNLNKKGE